MGPGLPLVLRAAFSPSSSRRVFSRCGEGPSFSLRDDARWEVLISSVFGRVFCQAPGGADRQRIDDARVSCLAQSDTKLDCHHSTARSDGGTSARMCATGLCLSRWSRPARASWPPPPPPSSLRFRCCCAFAAAPALVCPP